jgi:calcineurin-like phosphoesterase family protein
LLRTLIVLLVVTLLVPLAGTAEDTWEGAPRIVAIGDVHGDYGQFITLLQQAGLTDAKGKWTGGKAHFVQTGDLPDRGPDTRKIVDLMMRLEKQARKAGGRVHALIGNHDAMNIYGDLRYVTPGEYDAFKTGNSQQVRDSFWERHADELKKQEQPYDEAVKAAWYDEHPLGYFEHRLAWGPKGKYGKWVMSHNTVVKVNDTLFLHGGIGPRLAESSLKEINETVRSELEDFSLLRDGLAIADDGPLWYRGLAQGNEEELTPHVDATLTHYGVKRIVVGHTPTVGTVVPRFGGKVLMIDVGLAQYYGSRMACLVIENDQPFTLHRGKQLKLPAGSVESLQVYLEAAAALDPPPSPLRPLIDKLENMPVESAGSGDK